MPPVTDSPTNTTVPGPIDDATEPQGRAYWRSLDHLADTDEFRSFMHREFPAGASELLDSDDRRHFLKIMGASMALAGLGLAGCRRWPEEQIVPFASRPEGRMPGVPVQYATFQELGGVARGVLATAYDGRPVKIEGNTDHPTSAGAADLFAQASILDLYDPDRSRGVINEGQPTDWTSFVLWADEHFKTAKNKRGHGLAVLCESTASPTVESMRRAFLERYPNASWHVYESLNHDNELRGTELAFGTPYRPLYDIARAKVIVSLDADFLGTHPNAVQHIRNFARGRRVSEREPTMSRMYAIEGEFSLTGANADQRRAVRSADIPVVAAWIASRVLEDRGLARIEDDAAAEAVLVPGLTSMLGRLVNDLKTHRSECLIIAGERQPPEVHALAHLMNAALGNTPARGSSGGGTVSYLPVGETPLCGESLRELVGSKAPGTLVIIGGNPVYNAPADLGFAAWLEGVKHSIHLSEYVDETSQQCTWHVNRAHYLETWSDGRAWDGTYSIGQPIIEPLFYGRSAAELLAVVNGTELRSGQDLVRQTFAETLGGDDEELWRSTLHDGRLPGSGFTRERPTPSNGAVAAATSSLLERVKADRSGWNLVFAPHPTLYDGRYANNGWLQELPDPMTRLTWDNAVLVSPAQAEALGGETGDMLRVSAGDVAVEAPMMVIPGLPERTAVLPLGGGRSIQTRHGGEVEPGRICTDAGFDFGPLRTLDAMGFRTGADVERARGSYVLATVQDHHAIDVNTVGGRGIQSRLPGLFREADLEEYAHHPNFAAHRTHVVHRLSMWEGTNLEGAEYAWAMSVDLSSCVGCGACVAACQAENNIPIVGKEQVHESREMHWIRVDRYFRFAGEDGHFDPNHVEAVALQPVLCMQCENAPCEQVCPVAATVHDEDGLNVMVYNRCVGTRYCSNNCPYKVRRFNYFDYHRRAPRRDAKMMHVDGTYFERPQATPSELERLQFNPEVTVRMRGVMEKCTYCVQRITTAKIEAKNAFVQQDEQAKRGATRVAVADGAITPACAQTCPAQALVFGDLNDPKSRVSKLHRDSRSYQMLEELHVKARTRYLAKVRNPGVGRGGGDHGGPSPEGNRAEDSSHS